MRIAPATAEHLPLVLDLASATLKAHRARNPRAFPHSKDSDLIGLHKVAIGFPAEGQWTFLAWSNVKVEGYVTIKPLKYLTINPKNISGMIYDICVLPEARANGIGQLLVDHALAHARERNWKILVAVVWDGNDASHRLFKKADFESGRRSMFGRFFPKFRSTVYIHQLKT